LFQYFKRQSSLLCANYYCGFVGVTAKKENQYSVVKERRQKRIRSESEANFSLNIFNQLKVTSFLPIKTPRPLSLSSPLSLFLRISHQNLINPKKDI